MGLWVEITTSIPNIRSIFFSPPFSTLGPPFAKETPFLTSHVKYIDLYKDNVLY